MAGDERLMQLLRMMNKLLDKHPESRLRHLNFSAPLVVPIWPQVGADARARVLCRQEGGHSAGSAPHAPFLNNLLRRSG